MVKNLPMQETRVQSWEDTLRKEMSTRSSIVAFEIPWTEEPDRLFSDSPWGCKESDKLMTKKQQQQQQQYTYRHYLLKMSNRSVCAREATHIGKKSHISILFELTAGIY